MTTTTPDQKLYARGMTEAHAPFDSIELTPYDSKGYTPRPRVRPTSHPHMIKPEVIAPRSERVINDYSAPAARSEDVPEGELERRLNISFQPF